MLWYQNYIKSKNIVRIVGEQRVQKIDNFELFVTINYKSDLLNFTVEKTGPLRYYFELIFTKMYFPRYATLLTIQRCAYFSHFKHEVPIFVDCQPAPADEI